LKGKKDVFLGFTKSPQVLSANLKILFFIKKYIEYKKVLCLQKCPKPKRSNPNILIFFFNMIWGSGSIFWFFGTDPKSNYNFSTDGSQGQKIENRLSSLLHVKVQKNYEIFS